MKLEQFWRTCQSTRRSLSSLSASMRAFPVFCTAANQPLPPFLSIFFTLFFALFQSCPSSVSVPYFHRFKALSVWISPLLLSVSFFYLFLPQSLFLLFLFVRQSILSLSCLYLILSFFVFVSLSLSLFLLYLSGQWQCVGGAGGIDLTLHCSSHRAVWHSAYVMQMSV